MPELPEIEVLARQLRGSVVGETVVGVECNQPKMLNLPLPEFKSRALGPIIGTGRRGKSAILNEDDGSLWLHLGLSAEVRLTKASGDGTRPALRLLFGNGSELRVSKVFMGKAIFVLPDENLKRWNELGIEPLSAESTEHRLQEALALKANSPVKAALMDQRLIAGIGNIYSDEILRHAGINPLRRTSSLSAGEIARLLTAIRSVLGSAITAGGEVGYTDLYGRNGGFEPAVHGKVICMVCGAPVRKLKIQGRTGYFCSNCNP